MSPRSCSAGSTASWRLAGWPPTSIVKWSQTVFWAAAASGVFPEPHPEAASARSAAAAARALSETGFAFCTLFEG